MSESQLSFRDLDGDRFARHGIIAGWDQERLSRLGVVVFGAGALGNEVLKNLAMLGIGRLLVVDLDRIEASNLTRSALFREDDAGRMKAEVAVERVRGIWPGVEARAITGDLHLEIGPGLLASYDLALSCLDSLDARLGVDRLCRRAGIPWWNGGLGVSSAEVQRFDPQDGPCFACTLTRRALEREALRWSCQSGKPRGLDDRTMPTTAVSASVGGALLVQEALAATFPEWQEHALAPGGRLLWEAMPPRVTPFAAPRNPECMGHDDDPGRVDHEVSCGPDRSAREVAESIRSSSEFQEVHLPQDIVVRQNCACGPETDVLQPLRAATGPCERCGGEAEDLVVRNAFALKDPLAARPLRDLAVPPGGEIILASEAALVTVRLSLDPAGSST